MLWCLNTENCCLNTSTKYLLNFIFSITWVCNAEWNIYLKTKGSNLMDEQIFTNTILAKLSDYYLKAKKYFGI